MKGEYIFWVIWPLLLVMPKDLFSQEPQLYGVLPAVLLKSDINDRLSYSLQLSSETNAIHRNSDRRHFPARAININLEPALSFDADPNLNLAGGFLLRFRDPFSNTSLELRPWQQVTLVHRLNQYRFRNRLRLEQRWTENRGAETYDFNLRARYRFSTDFPLEGERLDDREFYLNISSEALITATSGQPLYFWENRTYLGLGYQFNSRNRLEPALEYRIRRIDKAGNRRRFLFLRIVWVAKLGK